jgi:hypothetical protein
MKKFLKYKLIFALSLGLIFPFGSSLFSAPAWAAATENSAGSPAKITKSEIKVVALAGTAKITAAENASPNSSGKCLSAQPGSVNLVQGAGALNLSQPAGCFNLQLGRLSVQTNLSVRPLAQKLPAVKVAEWPVTIRSPNFQAALPNSQPYIPFAVAALLLSVLMLVDGETKERKNISAIKIYRQLTVFQLQVLRC